MRALALFLVLAVTASAADVQIVRVFTGWRDAASFKRISEYFTGRENTGGEIVLRTHPGRRDGYYFLVRTNNTGAAREAAFCLEFVTPDSTKPRHSEFFIHLPAGSCVHQIGLTGPDWPDKSVAAVAWKLEVRDLSGAVLAETKSYLWEKPAGK